jgi:hypothetical protein
MRSVFRGGAGEGFRSVTKMEEDARRIELPVMIGVSVKSAQQIMNSFLETRNV